MLYTQFSNDLFDNDVDDALKYNELSYHKQVALCIIGYNSIYRIYQKATSTDALMA